MLFSRAYVPAWIAFIVLSIVFVIAEQQNRTIQFQAQRAEVQTAAGLIRSKLEGSLNADIQLVRGLIAVLSTDLGMSQDRFSEIADMAVGEEEQFINVAVAPGLVVSLVHPYEENSAVVGLDYRETEAQRTAVMRVRETGDIVLAGPVNLVQGGIGFIARFPVYSKGPSGPRFWGILSAVIDAEAVYRNAGITDPKDTLQIALKGQDGTGGAGALFFGDPAIYDQDPIFLEIVLPAGTWQLAAIPNGGWTKWPENLWLFRLGLLVAGSMVLLPTFLACRMSAFRRGVIQTLHQRERELAKHQKELSRLSTVAQLASDSIIVTDPEARIIWTNAAFGKMTGYTLDEVKGRKPSQILNGPETDPQTIAEISRHLRHGEKYRTEILNYTKSGEKIWVETHLVPVRDVQGQVSMVIGVERDITKNKQRERELANAKLAAEKADQAKSEFLANMSHEIRTPMNGIIGMAELLADHPLPAEQKQNVDLIRSSSKALLKIINDILDLSRLESGKVVVSDEDFELRSCIEDAVDLIRSAARDKGLEIRLEISDDIPTVVRADDGRLRQIFLNLVGNAVKFTSVGCVCVRATCSPHDPYRLIIEVTDTGIGMAPEKVDQVFERFSQADGTISRAFGGTGLGLTISQMLAGQMGGHIRVASSLGEGSVFTLEIQTSAPLGPIKRDGAVLHTNRNILIGKKVLLAEDNKTNRILIRKYLAGLSVDLIDAENGRRAVELCQSVSPDIVLMDVSMPELDGLAATQAIRNLPILQPPIIALTANAYDSDKDACLRAGMNAFLAKPISKGQLISTLAMLLAQDDPAQDPAWGKRVSG